MKIVRTAGDLRRETAAWRRQGLASAIVPTMGALHEGHIALIEAGLGRAQRTVVTIFVNPRQFGANEDLSRYPRDEAGDLAKLERAGAHLVYIPAAGQIYPEGFATTVHPGGAAEAGLEDRFRPHFFDGVATVVAKLFIQAGCDFAMFGEKDYQQLKVVTQMARDLDIATEVVGVPTMREADGLALSSRNRYLDACERALAPELYRALNAAAERIRSGASPAIAATGAVSLLSAAGFKVDYVEARDAETLVPAIAGGPLRLLGAASLGKTRLIDNIAV